jgi:hypothetical protein
MTQSSFTTILPKLLLPACLLMAAMLFAIALWPFNPAPRNAVRWSSDGSGLIFGPHGVIYSPTPLQPDANPQAACSLSLRIQPNFRYFHDSAVLLDFYTPQNPRQFHLLQWSDELLIRHDYRDAKKHLKSAEVEVEHAFRRDEPVTITITPGPQGLLAYRNGILAVASPAIKLSCSDFAGQLLVGNAPETENAWQGKFVGLLLYNSALSSEQVLHVDDPQRVPQNATDPRPLVHYDFTQNSERIVPDRAGSAPELLIPEVFRMLHKPFMTWPWDEPQDKLGPRDIAINIFGFVPFGFLCFAYLYFQRHTTRALVWTVIAGFAITAIIEVLQFFIPSRGSDVIDLLTNTFGTYLGALLLHWSAPRSLAARFGLSPSTEAPAK